MSQGILSPPAGLLSDEEVVVSPMFESTAADLGSVVRKELLSDCSVISTSLDDKQQVKELNWLGGRKSYPQHTSYPYKVAGGQNPAFLGFERSTEN